MLQAFLFAGLSAAGGLMQTQAANKAAKANAYAAILELQGKYEQVGTPNEQLLQEVDNIRLQAEGQVNERLQQLHKVKTNNAMFVASSGMAFNAAEGVANRASERKANNDVNVIELNAAAARRNVSQQIKVNRDSLRYAGMSAAIGIGNAQRHAQGVAQQALIGTIGSFLKYAPPMSMPKISTGE